MCCAVPCCAALQGVVRRDQSFWQLQWRRLKRMMFEVGPALNSSCSLVSPVCWL